ncbi:type 1 glutamine amidotransferase domain-containing protein [Fervidibacter sacchari]|jgi:intracellular protease, PfpI family|uniref:Protease I n=1 Tax=Candidatus Fervidibacter sacchari TaxID=1448929 RepID=A0ABT2ERU7_9BACT|nr:type 1 glutamine amidotransferase domain-containing protein [Candidatus Fervidibacter sacchari]MCS3920689.1 protease I [Candidatus Fervidibacter sacchari]WKU16339.1 type 1 glutamine amidotransferase domain-containing protein [Candidatus Fervidibacter sacchari]
MGRLEGVRVAVLVEDLYENLELWYPVLRLKEEGAEVLIVGPKAGETYKSKEGYPAKADKSAEEISADEVDAVIVPGGYAPDRMRRHEAMVRLVKEAAQKGKIVAAICHGGWMLAEADVIRGRTVTSFFAIKTDLINAGANWVDKEVVRDGNIVTSRVPSDLPAFMRTIIEALAEKKG